MSIIKPWLLVVVFTCGSYGLLAQAPFQFINENGLAQSTVLDVMKALSVDLGHYKDTAKNLPQDHIFNVYNFLKLFFNPDRDAYRKGVKPTYRLTGEQAQTVLRQVRGQYASFTTQDPVEKKKTDVIICSGVAWSLEKRFHSFKKFLEAGYQCEKVFFLSRTQELEDCVKRALELHKDLFKNIKVHLIKEPCESHGDFMATVKPFIAQEFYIVSDPEYALNLKESFTVYGSQQGLTCLGVFVRPITSNPDEYVLQEIKAYKFDEYIANPDDQMLAAAYSSLNILAHQVAQEIKLFITHDGLYL